MNLDDAIISGKKKTIFMLMKYYLNGKDLNLKNKFNAQMAALTQMGYQCTYLAIDNDGIYRCENGSAKLICQLKRAPTSRFRRISEFRLFYKAAIITAQDGFDITYVRLMPILPAFISAFKSIKQNGSKLVTEIPTYPPQSEQKKDPRWWRKPLYAISNCIAGRATRYVDLYTLIGETSNQYLGRPAINIVNGTQVSAFPPHLHIPSDNAIHILAIANMSYWHGYGRLIRGIYEYRKRGIDTPIYFHLVGPDADGSLAQWKALTKELGLEEYVLFEGSLYGDDLDAMVDSCDVAVDSLSAFKKDLHFGICLKVAEYCSRGIPFICCKPEDDREFQIPHCLGGIPEDDSPIDMERVIAFVRQEQKAQNVADELRAYAKGLSWEAQFTKIFDYFNHLEAGDAM